MNESRGQVKSIRETPDHSRLEFLILWLEVEVMNSAGKIPACPPRNRAGLADFLTVLDSERTLFANQDLLAQSQTALAVDLVALYKALGGGVAELSATAQPRPRTRQ